MAEVAPFLLVFAAGWLWGDFLSPLSWHLIRLKTPPPLPASAQWFLEHLESVRLRRKFVEADWTVQSRFRIRRADDDVPVTVTLESPGITVE